MTTDEQQREIEEAFLEERYRFKCPVHGWVRSAEGGVTREDHAECGVTELE